MRQGWGTLEFVSISQLFSMRRLLLSDFFGPDFQILFYLGHKLVGYCAVDQAVIVAQCEVDYGANGDGVVAVFIRDDHRLFRDSAYAHDGGVWLIDDGESEDGSELSRVGDGEGGAFDVFGLELLGAGTLTEI